MSTASTESGNEQPIFTAVSTSTRQIFQLLKCLNFTSKACVQIKREGIRFTTEDSHVMQAWVLLQPQFFSSFIFNLRSPDDGMDEDDDEYGSDEPIFMINLDALLETLQIFGVSEHKDRWNPRDTANGSLSGAISRGGQRGAFDNNLLGMTGVCRLSYAGEGEPLCIVLEETGITTTCELNTYEPDNITNIPFQRDAVVNKIITRAEWLFDAIKELSAASPTKLTITVSPSAPYFTLSASGPHGSASVEFDRDPQLLETFSAKRKLTNTYKYSMIKGASRAMAMASKVSIRSDEQGVLNLQFMTEVEEGKVAFVDFHFIPYIAEDDDETADEEEDYGEDFEDGEEVLDV